MNDRATSIVFVCAVYAGALIAVCGGKQDFLLCLLIDIAEHYLICVICGIII